MNRSTIVISLDSSILERLDQLVRRGMYPSRDLAIEAAIAEQLDRIQPAERSRLVRELAKLDPAVERALAEEGFAGDYDDWPAY